MEYREMVLRNCPNFKKENLKTKLSLGGLGLAGESGEVVDLIKKVIHHKKPLDKNKLMEEIGDVRWYLEYLTIALDTTMENIEEMNIKKLMKRYPDGFSYQAANKERKT